MVHQDSEAYAVVNVVGEGERGGGRYMPFILSSTTPYPVFILVNCS